MVSLGIRAAVAAALCMSLTGVALGQAATQPYLRHTFEDGESGWQALGVGGKVSVTHDAADVKEGKGALAFDYKVEKGQMGVLILPVQNGELTKARAIRFWIKTDYAAPMVVALQEKEGGRYLAVFTSPAGKWQQVELSPADFLLSEDANDPKDPDNKLDLNEVESVGIVDISQMFAQGDPMLGELLGLKPGDHRFVLDDFSVSAEPLAAPAAPSANEIRLEPMVRPQITWFTVGKVAVTATPAEGGSARSLQVDYHGAPGKAAGFIKRIPRGKLVGMDKVTFTCAAAKPAKLLVQLEEKGGGKYNVMIDIPGGKMPKEYSVKFSEFIQADDSKDMNGKLDLDEVQQLVFMDVLPWMEMTERDNTLWLSGLKAGR